MVFCLVRKLKKKDLKHIMKLWRELNIEAHSFIEEEYWLKNESSAEKMIQDAEVYIYEEKGKPRGFIGLNNNTVEGLFVEKDYQFSGIGKKLMKKAKSGRKKLKLYVYKKNEEALHFYLSEGFACTDIRNNPETGEEEYLMKWKKKED